MNESEINAIQEKLVAAAKTAADKEESLVASAQFMTVLALFEIAQQLRRMNELEAKRYSP